MTDNTKNDLDLTPFIDRAEQEGLDLYNCIVHKNGRLIAEKHWKPVQRIDIRSGTKSFCSTAVGFAVHEKLFSLDDYVTDCFAGDFRDEPSPLMKEMQLKHLMTMTMGFAHEHLMGAQRESMMKIPDWVNYSLNQEVIYHPGEKFLYNNIGPYLMGVLIQRRAGMGLIDYLRPRLFDPLGIQDVYTVEHCPSGYDFGGSGLMLDVFEYSKLGLLYLQDGIWEGKRILPEGWVQEATAPRTYTVSTKTLPGYELYNDNTIGATYGYFFWIGPWSKWYFACGAKDQYCVVVPEKDAVITVEAHVTQSGEPTIHAIAKEIIPRLP